MVQLKVDCFGQFAALHIGFQFLMVQLKEPAPAGDHLSGKFQFLMVQLKALVIQVLIPVLKFQFLMVQLKGITDNAG